MLTVEQTRSHFGRIGLGFFLMIVIQQVVVTIITTVIVLAAPQLLQNGWFIWSVSYLPLYLIAFPIFLLVMRGVPDTVGMMPPRQIIKLSAGQLMYIVLCSLGVVYALNMEVQLLSLAMEQLTGTGLDNALNTVITASSPFATLLFGVVVAPVMEEVIFRGILYKKLAGFGGLVYTLVSSFIFAMYHLNLYQFKYAFVLGLLFAAITWVTDGIKYTIILHMIINFIGSGVAALLLAYTSEAVVNIWTTAVLGIAAVGFILAVVWLVKNRRLLHFEPGALHLPGIKPVLLNYGMVLMMVLFVLLMGSTLLAPYMAQVMEQFYSSPVFG